MTDRVPVLLDTDIGSDIDDAVCLAYLLTQPLCDLLGITTVSGEVQRRAALADAICRAAGRSDVPIYPGTAAPLLGEQRQPRCPQADILGRWRHRSNFEAHRAVWFMREVIRNRPREVTLLAIGPMTNVALLFALDPEIPALLKSLVLMCGSFMRGGVEWNALCDPHAAAVVYQAPVPDHRSVGLDVTRQCRMDAETLRQRFRSGVLDIVADAAEVWYRDQPAITFHDPLAAAVIFQPDLCVFERGRVTVDLCTPGAAGATRWESRPDDGPHQVGTSVEVGRFFAEYFGIVSGMGEIGAGREG